MGMTIEVSIDEKKVLKQYLELWGAEELLNLVREVVDSKAIPEGNEGATEESQQCYFAVAGLDDLIFDLQKV